MVMEKDQRRLKAQECRAATGYYALCAVSGMLSAGTTHLAITPLDVLKVNMQVNILLNSVVESIICVFFIEGWIFIIE